MKYDLKKIPEIFLCPGEFHLSTSPEIVTTVLGSCISVIMYDTEKCISMMSHNLMPTCGESSRCKGDCVNVYKYAECSVKQMLKVFKSVGIPHRNVIIKLFGGSELINNGYRGKRMVSIGSRNIEVVKNIIEKEELKVVAQDLGGTAGRKIIFFTNTGEVFLSRNKYKGTSRNLIKIVNKSEIN